MSSAEMYPKLAIIVPEYNVAAYIQEALDSILAQSVSPDEVIVIDDGSTDKTADILNNYTNQPNFRIINIENQGLGPARNIGRIHANSDYIYFFDSDDLLRTSFVESIKKLINESEQPDIILFSGENFHDKNGYYYFLPPNKRTLEGSFTRSSDLLKHLADRNELFPQAYLYVSKKNIWSRNRIHFPPIIHEDDAIISPLIAMSELTIITTESFYLRRIRPNSILTSGINSKNAEGILRTLNETQEFMAREQTLVHQNISFWRKRLAFYAFCYIDLSRKAKTKIAWPQLLSAVLTSRSLKLILLIPLAFAPNTLKRLRKLKHLVKKRLCTPTSD